MADAPYSAYTNYTWTGGAGAFDKEQFNEIFVNSWDILSQGNGTLDLDWTKCLGCAVVERSLVGVGMKRSAQCGRCFVEYCWDGTLDEATPKVLDPSLALEPGVGFAEWNATSAL